MSFPGLRAIGVKLGQRLQHGQCRPAHDRPPPIGTTLLPALAPALAFCTTGAPVQYAAHCRINAARRLKRSPRTLLLRKTALVIGQDRC